MDAILQDEEVERHVTCTASDLIARVYGKDHKKIIRYFYRNRKRVPSF